MNITVTITVDLNVLQNASKCTISKEKIPKFFWSGGSPSPDPTPVEPPPNHISGYRPETECRRLLRQPGRGVYPYLPMATNAPWSILGRGDEKSILGE